MNLREARSFVLSRIGTERVLGVGMLTDLELNRMVENARELVYRKIMEAGLVSLIQRTQTANLTASTTQYTVTEVAQPIQIAVKWTTDGDYVKCREATVGWDLVVSGSDPYAEATTSDPVYRRLSKNVFQIYPAPIVNVTNGLQVDYIPDFGDSWQSNLDSDMGLPDSYAWEIVDIAEQLVRRRLGETQK